MASKAFCFLFSLTLLAFAPAPTVAAPWRDVEAVLGEAQFAGPLGWIAMCAEHPQRCAAPIPTAPIRLTAGRMNDLKALNRRINRMILPEMEAPGQDNWRLYPSHGDCDDYALTKRESLVVRGWPAGAMRFATVFTEENEYHLVLLIDTDRGTLVLDNRFLDPMPWARLISLGYRWVAIEDVNRQTWRLSRNALTLAATLGGQSAGAAR